MFILPVEGRIVSPIIASKRKRLSESADRDFEHLCRSQSPVFNFKRTAAIVARIFSTMEHRNISKSEIQNYPRLDSHQEEKLST